MIRIFYGNGNQTEIPYDPHHWTDDHLRCVNDAKFYTLYDIDSLLPLSRSGLWEWWYDIPNPYRD